MRRGKTEILRNLWLVARHGRQWWYWTPEWQAAEREAEDDIANGRVTVYSSFEEFKAAMLKGRE